MKYLCFLFYVGVIVAANTVTDLPHPLPSPIGNESDCREICTKESQPVCAISNNIYLVFENPCNMELYNCMHSEEFIKRDMKECTQSSSRVEYDEEKKNFIFIDDTEKNTNVNEIILEFLPRIGKKKLVNSEVQLY